MKFVKQIVSRGDSTDRQQTITNPGGHNIWQRQLELFYSESKQKVTPLNQEASEHLAETECPAET